MPHESDVQVTELLEAARQGDRSAQDRVLHVLYQELRSRARRTAGPGPGRSLEATDLIAGLYSKMLRRNSPWEHRRHFLNWASRAMESVLVDHARSSRQRRLREKAISKPEATCLDRIVDAMEASSGPLDELSAAIDRLAAEDARKASIIRLHFFGGMSVVDIAPVLQVSERTAREDLKRAKIRLRVMLT